MGDTARVDLMAERLRRVLGLPDDYPGDALPWPQIEQSDAEGAADRRRAGWLAWEAAEREAARLSARVQAQDALIAQLLAEVGDPA